MYDFTRTSLGRARLEARSAALEYRLRREPQWIGALFDGGWGMVFWLTAVLAILLVALTANFLSAHDWSYAAHAVVMLPLSLAVLVGLAVGIRRRLMLFRLQRARCALRHPYAPATRRFPLALTIGEIR